MWCSSPAWWTLNRIHQIVSQWLEGSKILLSHLVHYRGGSPIGEWPANFEMSVDWLGNLTGGIFLEVRKAVFVLLFSCYGLQHSHALSSPYPVPHFLLSADRATTSSESLRFWLQRRLLYDTDRTLSNVLMKRPSATKSAPYRMGCALRNSMEPCGNG